VRASRRPRRPGSRARTGAGQAARGVGRQRCTAARGWRSASTIA
jgi:hypothetical protein